MGQHMFSERFRFPGIFFRRAHLRDADPVLFGPCTGLRLDRNALALDHQVVRWQVGRGRFDRSERFSGDAKCSLD